MENDIRFVEETIIVGSDKTTNKAIFIAIDGKVCLYRFCYIIYLQVGMLLINEHI